jgi:peptidyl-prolyl cis-trans isomerase A (cyclophilin A)
VNVIHVRRAAIAAILATIALRAQSANDLPRTGVFRVKFETTAGDFVIQAHRDWAPLGAARFHELVESRYFDNSRFFRVVEGKWAQFGIGGDPKIAQAWRNRTISDDPVRQSNTPGYVAFAMTGPDARTTQIYINLGDNSQQQDPQGFSPFGKVTEGMDAVRRLNSEYGENSGGGMRAGKQAKLFEEGNAYLDREFPKLDKLIRARIISE